MDIERTVLRRKQPSHASSTTTAQPHRRNINTIDFAGRIGGNQEFSVSADDTNAAHILSETPDAAPISIRNPKTLFHLRGFLQPELYRQALLECYGSAILVYTDGMFANQLGLYASTTNSIAIALVGGLASGISLTLFIYAAAPASGGHLNPAITMAVLCLGLMTVSRAVLYIVFQSIGGIIGGFLLRLSLGSSDYFPGGIITGCTIDSAQTSVGQLFVLEWVQVVTLIFVATGVGLDPRQASVFGPALSPILIALALALILFASNFAKPGYHGACRSLPSSSSLAEDMECLLQLCLTDLGTALNPARCLGLMAADYNMGYHWVHWVAPICAALSNGLMYYIVPPYKRKSGKIQTSYSEP